MRSPVTTTTTQLDLSTAADSQKAWHILSLLLSIGSPTPPHDLALRTTLFHATPNLILSLCSIPNSPIALIDKDEGSSTREDDVTLVTVSLFGFFSIAKFASGSGLFDAVMGWIERGLHVPRSSVGKRKRNWVWKPGDENEMGGLGCVSVKRMRKVDSLAKVQYQVDEVIGRSVDATPSYMLNKFNNTFPTSDLVFRMIDGKFSCKLKDIKCIEYESNVGTVSRDEEHKQIVEHELDEEIVCSRITLDNQTRHRDPQECDTDLWTRRDVKETFSHVYVKRKSLRQIEGASIKDTCSDKVNERVVCFEEGYLAHSTKLDNISGQINTTAFGLPLLEGSDSNRMNNIESLDEQLVLPEESDCKKNDEIALVQEPIIAHVNKQAIFSVTGHSVPQKQVSKPYAKVKETCQDDVDSSKQVPDHSSEQGKAGDILKRNQRFKGDQMTICSEQKVKLKCDKMHVIEKKTGADTSTPKEQVESKNLPNFESYVVEEEEGSGGYGIVYRARRKTDGLMVAIKCPYANAHRSHVANELKMLERFGGKNFIIKYEGRVKNGSSDCFILEHVEHDRPEVLKKEIDIFQLRWYGYCLFKALASLHKQGIVHRDVKPGNFLFSRRASKGYLIDFNLATDLHQKYGTSKLKHMNDVNYNNIAFPNNKSVPPIKNLRVESAKNLETLNQEARKRMKSNLEPNNLKKRPVERGKVHKDLVGLNTTKSQGGEGSGITSLKDATSTRIPSAERLREPLPSQGRKELISLLQEAMHSPNHEASSVPAPMRKRVAAPPRRVDGRLIYISPMPLHTAGIGVTSTGKGDGKQKKEGPCVGTKGFRAPEVLFRSIHQGPKLDVWSAGVTLLYLIVGRTPFYGDPEQNIKDIAKLRGCEDLWELSKLHGQESQFPGELYDARHLPSMTLQQWCKVNTKRRDFLDSIPASLIDLVDRCLTVNPRSRISAEEALRHEFFAPCHEGLRKQRSLRQGLSLDSANAYPLPGQSIS